MFLANENEENPKLVLINKLLAQNCSAKWAEFSKEEPNASNNKDAESLFVYGYLCGVHGVIDENIIKLLVVKEK